MQEPAIRHDWHLSTLMSIKTGACPADCKYCPRRCCRPDYHAALLYATFGREIWCASMC
jgi:L-lysine 2,3-aminomutase